MEEDHIFKENKKIIYELTNEWIRGRPTRRWDKVDEKNLWGAIVKNRLKKEGRIRSDEEKKALKKIFDGLMRRVLPIPDKRKYNKRLPKPKPKKEEPEPKPEDEVDDEGAEETEAEPEDEEPEKSQTIKEFEEVENEINLGIDRQIEQADLLKSNLDESAIELKEELKNPIYIDNPMADKCKALLSLIEKAHEEFINSLNFYKEAAVHKSEIASMTWNSLWDEVSKIRKEIEELQATIALDVLYNKFAMFNRFFNIYARQIQNIVDEREKE